ncbi:hypothetical protein AB833_09750 [Chromatiales bacterium (ex Bugula neritina AB1)]|nr:hypothetical protein AB833_09750 [Chromatiales bacterium (ex Bugula neritina AB1)]
MESAQPGIKEDAVAMEAINLQSVHPPVPVLKTLLLQDSHSIASNLQSLLSANTQYQFDITPCTSPERAIEHSELCIFDLLIVDHAALQATDSAFLNSIQSSQSFTAPPVIYIVPDRFSCKTARPEAAICTDFLCRSLMNSQSLARSIRNIVCKHRLLSSNIQRSLELERVNAELKNKNREIRDFYQTVSHEVKTPLAAAREFIAIVRDGIPGPLCDEQVKLLDYALTSCDQIATHFNDLVDIARLDAGRVLLRKKCIPVESVVARTLASCAEAAKSSQIKINTDITGARPLFTADGDRITQVLSNLLSNAIKYSPAHSSIDLTVQDGEKNELIFSVADSGCGIPYPAQQRIFDRLYQYTDSDHQFNGAGLGLGLSIARELVLLHQGTIEVESSFGQGSHFSFTIPHPTETPESDQRNRSARNQNEQKNTAC